jgi:hypothetical protein
MKKLKILMALSGLMVGASLGTPSYARGTSCILFDCYLLGCNARTCYYNCARYCYRN